MRYAGLGFQLLAGLGLGVYAGIWLDKQLQMNTPLLVWILPLLIIGATMYRIIKDTSGK